MENFVDPPHIFSFFRRPPYIFLFCRPPPHIFYFFRRPPPCIFFSATPHCIFFSRTPHIFYFFSILTPLQDLKWNSPKILSLKSNDARKPPRHCHLIIFIVGVHLIYPGIYIGNLFYIQLNMTCVVRKSTSLG